MSTLPTSPGSISGITGTAGGVSNDASRLASAGNLEKAGQRFESIFTGMMLKSMRSAKLADGLFESKAGEQFRDMADAKVAESMAVHTPLGIGRAMTDFLQKANASAPPSADGGAS